LTVQAGRFTVRRLDVKRAVGAAVVILALVSGVGVADAKPTPAPKQPAGVDWGKGHFTAPDQLSTWLTDRGVRYDDWLQRHPRGGYLITHAAAAVRPAAPRARANGLTGAAFLGIYALAAALLLLAFTPSNLLLRVIPIRHHPRLATARTTFAAAGISLVLGVIVASFV
jgi:hypothetical protein